MLCLVTVKTPCFESMLPDRFDATRESECCVSDIQMIQIRPQSAPNLQCANACPMNNLTNLYTKLLPTCKKCAQVLMKLEAYKTWRCVPNKACIRQFSSISPCLLEGKLAKYKFKTIHFPSSNQSFFIRLASVLRIFPDPLLVLTGLIDISPDPST